MRHAKPVVWIQLVGVTVAFVLGTPGSSSAAVVAVNGGVLTFVAAAGETNHPSIRVAYETDGRYMITDADAPLNAADGCQQASSSQVTCAAVGVTSIRVSAGDLADVVHFGNGLGGAQAPQAVPTIPAVVDAGPGDDRFDATAGGTRLIGGPGTDLIVGGAGADAIEARDGSSDNVACGSASDTVEADTSDTIAADCETVDNGLPPAPAGPIGVSINRGAQFTNDPRVTLTLRWPRLAHSLFVSNDGGFSDAETLTVAPTVKWRLDASGPERLPKTIYARFIGGSAGPETYQDDIILDLTDPKVVAAEVVQGAGGIGARAAATSRAQGNVTVRLRASDRTSGVSTAQFAVRKSKPRARVRFKSRLTVRGYRPRYVRVTDRAGNVSRWKAVR